MIARIVLVAVVGVVVGAGTFVGGLLAAPIDFAVAAPPSAALLLAADGRQFATILPPERQEVVASSDIPQVMRDAIISAEDERFLKHNGVDPLATIRAAFRDLTGGISQGGSTLTQQYVKNAYVGNERSALRKIREAALAVRLEQKLSKQQILTDYLNALYLGNGLYGVQAAAKYYFGVPVKDLALDPTTGVRSDSRALARASMMAGLAPAPSAWNPVKDYATARVRQQYTLNRMVVGGYETPQQASDAFQVDVHPVRAAPAEPSTVAPEFADYVNNKIKTGLGYDEDVFFRGGLRVKTTLDLDLQVAFNQALKEVLPDASDPQAAIVAVDYRNGDVKAMATLRRVPERVDNKTGQQTKAAVVGYQPKLGFNIATNGHRSTGSTIKPFTLAEALIQGQTLDATRYGPNVLSIPNPTGKPNPYVVHNSEPELSGTFTLRRALADSVNTIFVPLANEIGRAKVAALAEAAGLDGPATIATSNLSFGIGGGVEVTPLSEAVAYGTLANGGTHVSPRTFTEIRSGASGTDQGQIIERTPASAAQQVMSPAVASEVVKAMTDVVTYGTGTGAAQPFPVFGKTGTTDDSTDAWFTGCIPDQHVCIATWMGYEYTSCRSDTTHVVGTACGGMHDIGGVRGQIFGGTLPAQIFARAQVDLRAIQAARAATLASPAPPMATATPGMTDTSGPSRTSGPTRPSAPSLPTRRPATPTPTATLGVVPSKTRGPTPTPTAGPTAPPSSPPVLFPTQPPRPTSAP